MRIIILLTVVFLSLCSMLISCQRQSSEEQLAYKMSKSENFKAIMNFGKQVASHVKILPDSAKNKLRQFKIRLDLLQKNSNLNVYQKRDSILKFVKSEPAITNTELSNDAKNMIPFYKRFNNEFPEFKKMSKEERSSVFKKAAAIFMKNLKT